MQNIHEFKRRGFFFLNNFIIFYWEEGRKAGEGNSRVILSLLTYQSQSYHFRDKVVFYTYKSHRYFKIRVQQIILYIYLIINHLQFFIKNNLSFPCFPSPHLFSPPSKKIMKIHSLILRSLSSLFLSFMILALKYHVK
jgi:hypothetical protein